MPTSTHNEYARGQVPTSETVSGWRIAIVKIGVIIALPAFISGAEIGFAIGLERGVVAIFIGGFVLTVIGMLTGSMAARSRLTTSLITQFTFGTLGGKLVNMILAATLLGWFGVTAQLFGQSVYHIAADLGWTMWGAQVYIVLGGLLMIMTTIYGFKALQKLSGFTVPLLLILIIITAYMAASNTTLEALRVVPENAAGIGLGISAIVGGLAASVTIFPDLCRFARTPGDARAASGLTFGLAMPIVIFLALIPSIATGQRDLIIIMTSLGLGIPALVLLVFKAWATNAGNLYSASLGAATFTGRLPQPVVVAIAGCIGVILAALGISNHFIPFLLLLGITIPPIAGVYITDFYLLRGRTYNVDDLPSLPAVCPWAVTAWVCGIGIASLTSKGFFTLSSIPAIDSITTASVIYLALMWVLKRHKTTQKTSCP